MKLRNILAVAVILLFSVPAFSQVKVNKGATQNSPLFSFAFTDIDSLGTYATEWFDASAILGQTTYFADSIAVSTHGSLTNDSFKVVVQGRFTVKSPSGTFYFQRNLATKNYITGATLNDTLNITRFAPEIRFVVSDGSAGNGQYNGNNAKMFCVFYSQTTNYLRQEKSYGNVD